MVDESMIATGKPPEICVDERHITSPIDRFVAEKIPEIEDQLAAQGCSLRPARLGDLPDIQALQRSSTKRPPARLLSDQSLFRILRFGRPLVVENSAGTLVGYYLAIDYNNDEKTAASAGLAVHESHAGRELGALVCRYSALRSMAAGARVQRVILDPRNLASLTIFLNKIGGHLDRFYRRFATLDDSRFTFRCPLTPEGLAHNRIDLTKLARFVQSAVPAADYRLLACDDDEAIERTYRETTFRIVALAPAGLLSPQPRLLALPAEQFCFTQHKVPRWR